MKIIEKSHGYLDIFSQSAHYHQDGNEPANIKSSSFFPGTLVVFRLSRDYTSTLQEALREIREENCNSESAGKSFPGIQFE